MAGDFNMSPQQLRGTGFLAKLQHRAVIVAPGRPTCRSVGASSELDFFVLTQGSARLARKPEVGEATFYPHSPVQLDLPVDGKEWVHQVLMVPQQLPVERVVGPLGQPLAWADTKVAVEEACSAAAAGGQDEGYHISRGYRAFAEMAEAELAMVTGAELRRPGARGWGPRPDDSQHVQHGPEEASWQAG